MARLQMETTFAVLGDDCRYARILGETNMNYHRHMVAMIATILCMAGCIDAKVPEKVTLEVESESLEKAAKELPKATEGIDVLRQESIRKDQQDIAELKKEIERLKAQPQPELSDLVIEHFAVGLPDSPQTQNVHSIIDGDLNSQVHRIDPVSTVTRDFGKQILRVEKVDWRLPGKADGRDHLQADVFVKDGTKLIFYFQVRNFFDGQPIRYPDSDKKPFDLTVRVYYRE